ncbi:arginine repressor [Anoxybacter fermentans]|uniref:Arginine repressor n=1 Tax=Anoxybacter fermentans TaxID=1323375 RepID=A0A3Q9HQW7_9FIRM|nr:arginine repressor [Anoxybacter fermentans]AZR73515.1 arginine repressor [Anoxybacter fermentans]
MKSKRHLKILEIIKNEDISTQEDLAARLEEEGIEVTQATVSRDIKKLGLIKIPTGYGGYKYALPAERPQSDIISWVKRMFQDFVVNIDYGENLIVVKSLPGTAQGLASSIDSLEWDEIMGTVAGDDTVFIAVKSSEKTEGIYQRLREFLY